MVAALWMSKLEAVYRRYGALATTDQRLDAKGDVVAISGDCTALGCQAGASAAAATLRVVITT